MASIPVIYCHTGGGSKHGHGLGGAGYGREHLYIPRAGIPSTLCKIAFEGVSSLREWREKEKGGEKLQVNQNPG